MEDPTSSVTTQRYNECAQTLLQNVNSFVLGDLHKNPDHVKLVCIKCNKMFGLRCSYAEWINRGENFTFFENVSKHIHDFFRNLVMKHSFMLKRWPHLSPSKMNRSLYLTLLSSQVRWQASVFKRVYRLAHISLITWPTLSVFIL